MVERPQVALVEVETRLLQPRQASFECRARLRAYLHGLAERPGLPPRELDPSSEVPHLRFDSPLVECALVRQVYEYRHVEH